MRLSVTQAPGLAAGEWHSDSKLAGKNGFCGLVTKLFVVPGRQLSLIFFESF
jgi:hypothetical protein